MAEGKFYKGKDLRLKFEGKTLYHATSCSLSVSTDSDEIATKDTDGKVFIPGSYGGSLSTDCLVADKLTAEAATVSDAFDLLALQLAGTEITWEFTNGVSGDRIISGNAFFTQCDITAEEAGISSGSFSLTTTGDITIALVA